MMSLGRGMVKRRMLERFPSGPSRKRSRYVRSTHPRTPFNRFLQISQYLTYRFTLYLTPNQYSLLTRLLQRLRIYSVASRPDLRIAGFNGAQRQDPNIVSQRSENTQRKYLKSYHMPDLPGEPSTDNATKAPRPANMAKLALKLSDLLRDQKFSKRWLIEGLVSHGIILPFEVQLLLQAMEEHCPTNPSGRNDASEAQAQGKFQERILTAMFNEERIKDINMYVKSECSVRSQEGLELI
jgi:hypothetical protein